jgi:hypothetical protein
LGIRVEGKTINEHVAAAITAYKSALEVLTRERYPKQWAGIQDCLGTALLHQAAVTEGTEGIELLAQAVTAYRNALEVYTREQLPQEWGMTQNKLAGGGTEQRGTRVGRAMRTTMQHQHSNTIYMCWKIQK